MRAVIGKFFQDQNGVMHGKVYALGIGTTSVIMQPIPDRKDNQPVYRLIADPAREAYEIGAAWQKEKDGMSYYSVSIESPALLAPFHAALFPDKDRSGTFNLIFDRYQQTPVLSAGYWEGALLGLKLRLKGKKQIPAEPSSAGV